MFNKLYLQFDMNKYRKLQAAGKCENQMMREFGQIEKMSELIDQVETLQTTLKKLEDLPEMMATGMIDDGIISE